MNLKRILATALAGGLMLAAFPAIETNAVGFVPEGAVASVTVNGVTSYYYDNATSGGAEAMWNTAMTGTEAMVVLYADWVSSYGTRMGEGDGFIFDGVLCVPTGHEITIDLNGYSINRNLEFAVENGEVMYVANGGVLNLTDTNTELGNIGSITGGNSLDGAGGIYIDAGGVVNMWGGNIVNNYTEGSGGGVLLAGDDSELNISGGNISDNTAAQCGGGVAMSGGVFKLVSGEIANNTAQSGGGVYAQNGSVDIAGGTIYQNMAIHGGGILLNGTTEMTLKGQSVIQSNVASGENRLGGGILAMSSSPIKISGKPTVLNNSADSVQSNLVFWIDTDTQTTVSSYVQDAGTSAEAKIGVSTSGNIKEIIFAPSWSGADCFLSDVSNYVLQNKNGGLVLHRTTSYSDLIGDKIVWIVLVVILIVLAIIAILILAFRKNKTPEEKSTASKKKVIVAKKKSKAEETEEEPEEEYKDDEDEENVDKE